MTCSIAVLMRKAHGASIEGHIDMSSQELKHYSQASQDLQQALQLQPSNKTFATALKQLELDIMEQRKQRAVAKQLSTSSTEAVSPAVTETAQQPTQGSASSRSTAHAHPVLELEALMKQLQGAGAQLSAYNTKTFPIPADQQLPRRTRKFRLYLMS